MTNHLDSLPNGVIVGTPKLGTSPSTKTMSSGGEWGIPEFIRKISPLANK